LAVGVLASIYAKCNVYNNYKVVALTSVDLPADGATRFLLTVVVGVVDAALPAVFCSTGRGIVSFSAIDIIASLSEWLVSSIFMSRNMLVSLSFTAGVLPASKETFDSSMADFCFVSYT
jgi:hypothetical protein